MNPPKLPVRLLRASEDDSGELLAYVAADRPRASEALAEKMEKGLLALSGNPRLGRIPREDELARAGYRYLVVENYLVFYVIEQKAVYVHRILHGARDYLSLL